MRYCVTGMAVQNRPEYSASIQTTKDHYAFPSLAQKQEVVIVGGVVITESVNQEWPDDEDELARICGLR